MYIFVNIKYISMINRFYKVKFSLYTNAFNFMNSSGTLGQINGRCCRYCPQIIFFSISSLNLYKIIIKFNSRFCSFYFSLNFTLFLMRDRSSLKSIYFYYPIKTHILHGNKSSCECHTLIVNY